MHLGMSRSQAVTFSLMVACIVLLPLVLYPVFLMKVMCYALFACAFNLVLGYAGLLPFGHAAFFGTGAYIGAWTAKALMLTPELAILCGGAAGGILGVAFGFLAIRRQGLDFAMITLALAQMTYFFYLQAPFTNGEDGIQKVPRGDAFGLVSLEPDMTMYWFVSAIFLGGFAFIYRVIHSPFGNVLKGIRENEVPRLVTWLPRQQLQAHRVRAVRLPGRDRGRHQDACLRHRHAFRRQPRDIVACPSHGLAGRQGNHIRTCRRRRVGGDHGEQARDHRVMGHDRPGRRVHRLRPAFPARHCGRDQSRSSHQLVTRRRQWQSSSAIRS